MTGSVRVLVVLDPSVTGEQVMPSVPVDDINVVGTIDDPTEMLRALERTRADLLLLACDHGSDGIVQLIGDATRQRPGRPVLVLCAGAPNGFVRQVFDAGADDIVELPQSRESVRFLIEKAIARRQPADRTPARMVVVLGPKGGTGKTLTACNLGVLLAERRPPHALIDIDLQFGDVGLALGLRPDRTIYDLATSRRHAGRDQGRRLPDPPRVGAGGADRARPPRPGGDRHGRVAARALRDPPQPSSTTWSWTRRPGFTPEVIASIDLSTDICVVGTLDTLSLKNTRLGLETLELMGYPDTQISLLLNRAADQGRHHRRGRRGDRGPHPRCAGAERPRHSPLGQRGHTDRDLEPKSDAAKAFAALTARYLPVGGSAVRARPPPASRKEGMMDLQERLSAGQPPPTRRSRMTRSPRSRTACTWP